MLGLSVAEPHRIEKPWVPISLGILIGGLTIIALWPQIFGPNPADITDIYDHLLLVKDMGTKGSSWNLYSLFFVLVYILSFGSKNFGVIAWAGTVILTASVIAKGLLSYFLLRKTSCGQLSAALVSVALVLIMPLPNWWKPGEIYLDKIAPTIWFNSTAILAMPFAILLFLATVEWLERPRTVSLLWVLVFSLLSVLTKPNYVLAIVPVVWVILFVRAGVHGNSKTIRPLLFYAGLTLIVLCVLGFQYLDTFNSGPSGDPTNREEASHIIVAPFVVWSIFSPNIPASLLLSVAFPLSVAVLYFEKIRHNFKLTLAWAVWAVAVLQYVLLAESGDRLTDGNWGWGSNIAMYIVFLMSAAVFMAQARSPRFYFVLTLFSLHLISGIYYYIKLALGLGYD